MTFLTFLIIFSTLSFLFFGISCFFTEHMRNEFIRYGLSHRLKLIGTLQILGAIGLGIGYLYLPWLSIIAAIGLSILMILGFGVRLKIKDTLIQSAPSLIYAVINTYISISLYQAL
ncbi:MAG: DoxX family protein [Gramella sp.]|nr:DoxX family protein [Christiangramia sp.]